MLCLVSEGRWRRLVRESSRRMVIRRLFTDNLAPSVTGDDSGSRVTRRRLLFYYLTRGSLISQP